MINDVEPSKQVCSKAFGDLKTLAEIFKKSAILIDKYSVIKFIAIKENEAKWMKIITCGFQKHLHVIFLWRRIFSRR